MFSWNEALRFALDATLKVTLLLLAALVLRSALGFASAALRHALTTVALAGALLLPLLSPWLPRLQVPVLANPFPKSKVVRVERSISAGSSEFARRAERIESSSIVAVRPSGISTSVVPRQPALSESSWTASRPAPIQIRWPLVALVLWAIGVLFGLARLAAGT